MTDHHDFGDHHFDDEPLPFEEHPYPEADQLSTWDDNHHDFSDPSDHGDPFHEVAAAHEVEEPLIHDDPDTPPVDAAAAEIPDMSDDPVDVFPPSVDVGELPEPVDGLPWIDSGSLGLADIQAALHEADTTEPVAPQELAEYAATDLPPGVDPWAALAESDDPATSALARWWSEN